VFLRQPLFQDSRLIDVGNGEGKEPIPQPPQPPQTKDESKKITIKFTDFEKKDPSPSSLSRIEDAIRSNLTPSKELEIGGVSPIPYFPMSWSITPFVLATIRYSALIHKLQQHLYTLNNIQIYLASMNSNNWKCMSDEVFFDFFNLLKVTNILAGSKSFEQFERIQSHQDQNNAQDVHKNDEYIRYEQSPLVSMQVMLQTLNKNNQNRIESNGEFFIEKGNNSPNNLLTKKDINTNGKAIITNNINIDQNHYSHFEKIHNVFQSLWVQRMIQGTDSGAKKEGESEEISKLESDSKYTMTVEPFVLNNDFISGTTTPDITQVIDFDKLNGALDVFDGVYDENYSQKVVPKFKPTNLPLNKPFRPALEPTLRELQLAFNLLEKDIQIEKMDEDKMKLLQSQEELGNDPSQGPNSHSEGSIPQEPSRPDTISSISTSSFKNDIGTLNVLGNEFERNGGNATIDGEANKTDHFEVNRAKFPKISAQLTPEYQMVKLQAVRSFQDALYARKSVPPQRNMNKKFRIPFQGHQSGQHMPQNDQNNNFGDFLYGEEEQQQLLAPFFFHSDDVSFWFGCDQGHTVVPLPHISLQQFLIGEHIKYNKTVEMKKAKNAKSTNNNNNRIKPSLSGKKNQKSTRLDQRDEEFYAKFRSSK